MIRLTGLNREFQVGEEVVHALSDVDLCVGRGEYLSIMGPSGSGKSTLLHILGLLDRPSSGRYELNGEDVAALNDERLALLRGTNIGFVFQFFHLVPRMTALQNVELPLLLQGMESGARRQRAEQVLRGYGLAERLRHKPDQLSGGQRQRVAIARATVTQPALILADEPTGNLDRGSGHEVIEILEKLHRSGVTLIVVTHDPELGGRAARRLRMVDGRIVYDSSPQ
jgi:putative ABC transport system ATP-binding protein